MEELVDEGLVRHIGISNFSVKQVEELLEYARIKPVANQVELHPFLAQRKLVGVCARKVPPASLCGSHFSGVFKLPTVYHACHPLYGIRRLH